MSNTSLGETSVIFVTTITGGTLENIAEAGSGERSIVSASPTGSGSVDGTNDGLVKSLLHGILGGSSHAKTNTSTGGRPKSSGIGGLLSNILS